MPSRRRSAPRAASRRIRSPSPVQADGDEEMAEINDEGLSPQAEDVEAEDMLPSPPPESQEAESPAASIASPPPSAAYSARGRGRGRGRRGRPPTKRIEERGTPDAGGEDGSDSPLRKRRGGFRGRPRRGAQGPSHHSRIPLDKDGNIMEVEHDEVVLPEDPEGEEKVNKDGELQGGREYRVRTFSVSTRGGRLYMLSTEPARCTGYRDSYLFFAKHPKLFKIILEEAEKKDLIAREILPNSYKGRAIGVVTARSVFREFGAKIVVGGKRVTDDYNSQEARANGAVEGELADPHDRLPPEGEPYNRNQYVAWHGASSVYHQNLPNVPLVNGMAPVNRKRPRVTGANWMLEHARSASLFNSELTSRRKQNLNGLYEPHTNLMCFPQIMQPTQAKWELVKPKTEEPQTKKRRIEPMTNGEVDAVDNTSACEREFSESLKSLNKPSETMARKYLIVDTQYVTPPHASLPRPSERFGDLEDVLGTSLDHRRLPQLSEDELETLAPEARESYSLAKRLESAWASMWRGERIDGARGTLRICVGTL